MKTDFVKVSGTFDKRLLDAIKKAVALFRYKNLKFAKGVIKLEISDPELGDFTVTGKYWWMISQNQASFEVHSVQENSPASDPGSQDPDPQDPPASDPGSQDPDPQDPDPQDPPASDPEKEKEPDSDLPTKLKTLEEDLDKLQAQEKKLQAEFNALLKKNGITRKVGWYNYKGTNHRFEKLIEVLRSELN